ncbi:hypothetical protein N7516_008158, partial [Penicillium verrucosum]|uniref:uncharacterized protein n=1 Tax=Penicillium verrucosum TaxID=60171 RepID=UPI002544E2C6
LGTPDLKDAIEQYHNLDPRIILLVLAYQRLRKNRYRKGRKTVPKTRLKYLPFLPRKYRALAKNNILRNYTYRIHFDSKIVPLPRRLLIFFADPYKQFDIIYRSIYRSYTKIYIPDTLVNFEGSLRKLLGLLERDVIRGDVVLFT